jgi:hypothetical protein
MGKTLPGSKEEACEENYLFISIREHSGNE